MSGGDWKQMFKAAEEGDLHSLKYYTSLGIDFNYQHPEVLSTPLIESAERGHLEIVKFLLDHGADPSIKSELEGWTALEAARKKQQWAIVDLLSKY